MIRRQEGNEYWLIAQHDHATLSGRMAEAFGADGFAAPDGRGVLGIALHDCGWPIHDDSPTLNNDGLPLDVFETPRHIGTRVWTESAARAAARDPYAGLLVSLHSLSLSIFATTPTPFAHERFDMSDPANRFEINKFQQRQIELQEALRRRLGLRTDEPRRFGLGEESSDPREQQLIFDFRLLQAMDRLSLGICCTTPPADGVEKLPERPGGVNRPLRMWRTDRATLAVQPWPFTVNEIELSIPVRRLPAQPFADETGFRVAYAAAPVQQFECRVVRT